MARHLMGVSTAPGSSSSLREQAAQITTTTNTVNGWIEQVREDARQLAAMTDQQLLQQPALTLLNDMAMNANFALNGQSDQVNGNTQEGVQWIYFHIQHLATMDIMPYQEQK